MEVTASPLADIDVDFAFLGGFRKMLFTPLYVANQPPLPPSVYITPPLGAIKPRGWLLKQLRIQADGLSGHIDEFWPDLGPNSGWLGGTGEAWERGPYYLDGFVPLAYLLDDPKLIAKSQKWIEWVLTHQSEDSWLGPPQNKDWWPLGPMLKALTQYQEATRESSRRCGSSSRT